MLARPRGSSARELRWKDASFMRELGVVGRGGGGGGYSPFGFVSLFSVRRITVNRVPSSHGQLLSLSLPPQISSPGNY